MPGDPALTDHVGMLPLTWKADNPTESPQALIPGNIHLWTMDLSVCGDWLMQYLTPTDRARGSRIADEEKRILYLGGRAGMRLLLAAYTGIPAGEILFGYGSRGKPRLANDASSVRPRFNYTLSRDKVLYALALERELGVDMEALPRRAAADLLAARKLTDPERTAWGEIPRSLQNDAMLCCWTRKEAYGKALGVGIRYNLGQVTLFGHPSRYRFRTSLEGLFTDTDSAGMPDTLEGVQLGLPFPAVAALMFPADGASTALPSISANRLVVE